MASLTARLFSLLVLVPAVLGTAPAQTDAGSAAKPAELLQLEKLYLEKIEEETGSLREGFLSSLEALEKRLADGRKLEEALYVREQRTKFALDRDAKMPAGVGTHSEELARLYGVYKKHRDARVRPVRMKYLTALKRMESQMVGERRLADAVFVKKELERLEKEKAAEGEAFRQGPRGTVPDGDVALSSKGATAVADSGAALLIDGDPDSKKFAHGEIPAEFLVTLNKVYALKEIRFRLYDLGVREYKYILETSVDGKTWNTVADRSRRGQTGWQDHRFDPTDVRHIRIRGLGNTANNSFHISEVIAK